MKKPQKPVIAILAIVHFCHGLLFADDPTSKEMRKAAASTAPADNREASVAGDAPGGNSLAASYGLVDSEGFPTNPEFAMNSDKILEVQRSELRRMPPEGYQIRSRENLRFLNRKDDQIEWRNVLNSGTLGGFLGKTKMRGEEPIGLFHEDRAIFSPTNMRMLVVADSRDRGRLFEQSPSGWDLAKGSNVSSITFDDRWRWYISWKAFMTESLIVGISATDDDMEKYPELRLYTFDLDKAILSRLRLPPAIQPKGVFTFYQIEAVSPNALLMRSGHREGAEGAEGDLFTVYLD